MIVRELISRFGFDVDKKDFDRADGAFRKLKKAAGAAVAFVATGAVAAGVKKILDLGSDAAETMNVLDVAFGNMAPAVTDWARVAAAEVGRSEFQLREYAATIGAMTRPMLGSEKAAADMSKQIAMLAVDLGSLYKASEADTLTALKAGLIGSTEPLRNYGIVMSVAALDAFALAEGLSKTTKEMSEEEKLALRFRFIMKKSAIAQGDAAKTVAGYANATKAFRAAIGDFFTRLGLRIIPTVEKLLAVMIRIVPIFGEKFFRALTFVRRVLTPLWWYMKAWTRNVRWLVGGVIDLTKWLFSLLTPMQKVAVMAAVLVGALLFPATSIITLIALISLLIEDFVLWWEEGNNAITVFGKLDEALGGVLGKFRDWFQSEEDLTDTSLWQSWGDKLGEIWDSVLDTEAWKAWSALLKEIWGKLGEAWSELWTSVKEAFANAWDAITEIATKQITKLKNLLTPLMDKLPGFISEGWASAKEGAGALDKIVAGGAVGVSEALGLTAAQAAVGGGSSSATSVSSGDIEVNLNLGSSTGSPEQIAGAVAKAVRSERERDLRKTARAFAPATAR